MSSDGRQRRLYLFSLLLMFAVPKALRQYHSSSAVKPHWQD